MSEWIVYSKDGLTERCRLKRLEYNGSFMNERTILATFEYHSEVAFDVFDYIVYRNEKFELESIPSVKKISNHNYEYELRFVSLKYELERCEMRDIVPNDNGVTYPTPLTFSFTGDVRYLTERIQANLDSLYGEGVWSIVIPEGVKSEEKNITISQQNCWNALSLVNTTYNLTFSIKGRVITIGGEQSLVGHVFQYGKGKGLYEIERVSDTDTGIVTKVRAYGGTRNLDYSYPKRPEWTDSVLPVSFALSPLRLMLPSFKLDGKTDYVLADDSIINEYGIREASVVYDDIYPSITGMRNSDDEPIDEIKSVDEVDDSKDTFVVYLYDLGFDLESNLTTENAQISMKSGSLIGYTFNISEIEKQEDNSYKITLGRITNEEGDTGNFNIPNSQWSIAAGDKFVLLNILMPQEYIRNAEERLLERAQEYLNEYGRTNFSYNVGLHDKFLKENADIYEELIEGSKLRIYDQNLGISEDVTIQSITITENMEDNVLTQVKVTLNNKPSASTIERIQGQIKELSETSAGQFSTQSELLKQYRRKLDKPFFDRLFAAVDINGNEIQSTDLSTPIAYIKARYSVASIGGFTMYLNDNSYNLPSIYDGLPIDNNTIYWENGILKSKGGGGIAESVSWADITGKPEWLLDGKISYSEVEGTPDLSVYALKRSLSEYVTKTELSNLDYADKDWVKQYVVDINTGNITAITKQMVIDALEYTPYNSTNPAGYITSTALNGYATQDWVTKRGYLTSIPSEYVTETELTNKGYATTSDLDSRINALINGAPDAYDTLQEIADVLQGNVNSIGDILKALGGKADKAKTLSGYGITDAYTKTEVNTLLNDNATQTWVKSQGYLTQHQDLSGYQKLITSSNKLAYALISGTPTALPNPTALKFGTKSYDGSAERTILASDLGALTSHQAIYTLTFQSGTFASGSFTANSGNKTINIPTTTSHVSEGNNLYFTNARAVSALGDTLKSYVALSGSQTVSGEKNFTGGLKVNGSPIVYDAAKKYWKLEGDLLITGGLTMYGSDSSFTPSTIMDAISVDGTTISKEGGVLRVIGGGGISSITKQMVIDALEFTPISSSDVPTALPNPHSLKFGSKLYDGSASKTILASDLGITWDDILGRPTLLSSFTDDVVAGKYLPLSGGVVSSNAYIAWNTGTEGNDVNDWNEVNGNGLRIISSLSSTSNAPTTYSTALHVKGRYGFQLASRGGANDNFYIKNIGTSDARDWMELIHSGNYSSYALPLSGGTITSSDGVPLNINSTAGYTVIGLQINGILYSVFGADEYWGTYLGVAGKNQKLGIKPDGTPYYNEYSLIHSGNYSSYALPLSGGTITIDSIYSLSVKRNGTGGSFVAYENNNGNLGFLGVGDDGVPKFAASDGVGKKIWHEGNFTPANYLPLSGGEIKGDLIIGNGDEKTWIHYFKKDINAKFGAIGVSSLHELLFDDITTVHTIIHSGNYSSYALPLSGGTISEGLTIGGTLYATNNMYLNGWFSSRNHYFFVRDNADADWIVTNENWTKEYSLIHSGNIGSQSVASAASASSLTSEYLSNLNNGGNNKLFYSGFQAENRPGANYATGLTIYNNGLKYTYQFALDTTGDAYIRYNNNSEWQAWKQLAFTDSNVSSATKLQTARTIWGQSFDGTGDVDGTLTIRGGENTGINFHNTYGTYNVIRFYGVSGENFAAINAFDSYASQKNLLNIHATGGISLGAYFNPAMLINSSGNVTIGASDLAGTSANAKLYVDGNVLVGNAVLGASKSTYNRWGLSHSSNVFYIQSGLSDGSGVKGNMMLSGINTQNLALLTIKSDITTINGNVGIGTTNPSSKLEVNGNVAFGGAATFYDVISVNRNGSSGAILNTSKSALKVECYNTYTSFNTYTRGGVSNPNVFVLKDNGNIGIGTTSPSQKLHVDGNILTTGGVTMYGSSDRRLKKNIRTFNASQELMKLGGIYEFEYIDEEIERNDLYKGIHVGLIYQNVKGTILEKMRYEREDGYGALNYLDTSFICLIAAVGMEHETRLQKLERENIELKKELAYVRGRLEDN